MLAHLLIRLGAYAEGDFAQAAPRLRAALDLAEELDDDAAGAQPLALLLAGRAALYLGDDRAAHRTHHAAAARARASGAISIVTQILPRLATEVWEGCWSSAAANAREGLQLAREIGQRHVAAQQLVMLGLIAALRGSEDECRSLAAESRGSSLLLAGRDSPNSRSGRWRCWNWDSVGPTRLSDAVETSPTTPVVFWGGLDRIEAAIRAGEPETASAWLEVFERWAESGAAA